MAGVKICPACGQPVKTWIMPDPDMVKKIAKLGMCNNPRCSENWFIHGIQESKSVTIGISI